MARTINAFDSKAWNAAGLEDYGDFSECVEYCNQRDDYCDSMRGDWYYIPEACLPTGERVIYFGTFANDHSPGASMYTNAEIFDMGDEYDKADYAERVQSWESMDEYAPRDEDDEDDEE